MISKRSKKVIIGEDVGKELNNKQNINEEKLINKLVTNEKFIEALCKNEKLINTLAKKLDFNLTRRLILATGALGALTLGMGTAGAKLILTDKFVELDGQKFYPASVSAYDVIVRKEGSNILAEDMFGKIISKGIEGVDEINVIRDALNVGDTVFIKDEVDLPLVELNPVGKIVLEQGIELYGLGYKPSITDPTSLTWNLRKVYDIANKLQPLQLLYENNFNTRLFNYKVVFGDASLSLEDGKLKYSTTDASAVVIKDYKVEYPSIVIVAKIENLDDTGIIRLGISDLDYSNYVQAIYYGPSAPDYQNTLRFEVRVNGGSYTEIRSTPLTLTFPAYLMVVITGTYISFFYSTDGVNFTYVLKGNFKDYLQLQNESLLNIMYPLIGFDNSTSYVDFIKIYHTLPLGIADLNPVTYEDGNPIIIDNKLYFTASLRGIGSGTFETHTAIFSLNLDTFDIELVSIIYAREYLSSISDYAIFFDHASHVMYDRKTKTFRVFFSAWDDAIRRNRVCVKIAETKQNLLNPGIYVLDIISDTSSLISTLGNHYDPFAWYDYKTKKYYIEMAYDTSNWMPALIETKDFKTFSIVIKTTIREAEGGSLFKMGGKQYIITSKHKVFSKDLTYLGTLNIPEYLGAFPWGFIVPKYELGKSKYLYIVFGHHERLYSIPFTYGRVYIFESLETEEGYPYWITKKFIN